MNQLAPIERFIPAITINKKEDRHFLDDQKQIQLQLKIVPMIPLRNIRTYQLWMIKHCPILLMNLGFFLNLFLRLQHQNKKIIFLLHPFPRPLLLQFIIPKLKIGAPCQPQQPQTAIYPLIILETNIIWFRQLLLPLLQYPKKKQEVLAGLAPSKENVKNEGILCRMSMIRN